MTKFDSNMERDMNRCAVALEKLTKLVTLQNEKNDGQFSDLRNMLGSLAVKQQKLTPKPARRTKK
tara:strand:- start:352 stop:546 length:195 start_codon:yes stop_codon:yes gene_type:complete